MAFHGSSGGRFAHSVKALSRMKEFFKGNSFKSCPAVDLASGSAVFARAFSRHFCPPEYVTALEWYPTERDVGMSEIQEGLNWMKEEVEAKGDNLLFTDANGVSVHVQDRVKLEGLSKEDFNGLVGTVCGCDPKNEGRFAVILDGRTKEISFKGSNIVNANEIAKEASTASNANKADAALIDTLLGRARELDIQKRETWSNEAELNS